MHLELPIRNRISFQWSYGLWLFVILLSGYLQASGQVPDWRYDYALINNGDYWLLLTGNVVHMNWSHWGLNMIGLCIVAYFFSAYASVLRWMCVVIVSAIFVGLGLYWLNPEVMTYVGLSGVLHGLFIYSAAHEVRFYPTSGYVLMVLLIGKLIWESMFGALPGSEEITAIHVVTESHLYGAIGGGLSVFLLWLFDQLIQVKNRQKDAEYNQ